MSPPFPHARTEASIRLVVNADGFGKTAAISRGILRAHTEGIVTSTSVFGTLRDPADARALLAAHPALGVGLHAVLLDDRPVSPPEMVRSLLDEAGRFPATPAQFALRWLRGQLRPEELERELDAQVTRLRDAGLGLDHMDTHLHLGCLPPVAEALAAVAARHRIGALRIHVEAPTLSWFVDLERGAPLFALHALARLSRRRLGARAHGAQAWGYVESGNLGKMRILEILGRLGPGIHELICHPGEELDTELMLSGRRRVFDRKLELDALCSPTIRAAIAERGISLHRFADLF